MTTPNRAAPFPRTGSKPRRSALPALCLAGFVIQLDVTIVNVALPAIQRGFAAGPGALEWTVSGYALGLAAFIPLMGALGDRLGHRRVLLPGLAAFGLCSAGAALAPDPAVLVAARVGQGVGGAAVLALTLAVLTDAYPPGRRGHAIGWWAAVGGLGFGAGPVLGGLLLSVSGWPAVFWVNVPVVAATMGLVLRTVPASAATGDPRPLDVPGVVLASLGLSGIAYGLITMGGSSWRLARTLVPLLLGAVLLAWFARWQRRAAEPLVPRAVRGDAAFLGACAVNFLAYLAFSGALYHLTLLFQNVLGWSALRTGLSWLLMNIPFLAAARSAGRLGRRFTPRALVTAGCAAGALGVAALTPAAPFAVAAFGYLVSGAGFGLLVPGVVNAAMRNVAAPVAGAASAVLNASRQLGTAVGLALVGAVGAAVTRYGWESSPDAGNGAGPVAAGNLDAVPAPLRAAAGDAFQAGYRAALAVCVASLLLAGGISARAFRPGTRPREHSDDPSARRG